MLYLPLLKQLKICIFFFSVENRWKDGLCSAEAACVWLHPRCSITPHSEVEFLSSGCVLCVCESAPGQHHTDTLINHWSLFCFWSWILQGGAMIAAPLGPSEIWHWKSLVLFECKVISISVADGWLGPVCVCVCVCNVRVRTHFFFCVGVSAFVSKRRGRGKQKRKSEGRKNCSVCGWYMRFFLSEKNNIIQTKQQEMKFAMVSLCHPPKFQPAPWEHHHKKCSSNFDDNRL